MNQSTPAEKERGIAIIAGAGFVFEAAQAIASAKIDDVIILSQNEAKEIDDAFSPEPIVIKELPRINEPERFYPKPNYINGGRSPRKNKKRKSK
ncbi:MAG: hypothetical protein QM791_04230 [Ferruginibacter sp.]